MWALFWAALAQAGTPPNIRLDDIEKWEDAAEHLLDMPRGCWEWVGQASWDWHTGKYGKTRGDAVFAGKTTDGVWGEIALQPLGELQQRNEREREARVYAEKARFVPMVGRLPGGRVLVAGQDEEEDALEDAEALNVLRQVLRRVGGEAFTSWAEWDEARGGVVLHRAIPLASNRKEEVKVQIFFPNGGDEPSLLDVKFPKKFKAALRGNEDDTQLGKIKMGLFAFTIKEAEVHVRGLIRGNVVYPSSEAFRFRFGFLGFKYHGAQTVVYRQVKRCPVQPLPEEGVTAPPAADAMVRAGTLEDGIPTEPTGDDASAEPMTDAESGDEGGIPTVTPAAEPSAEDEVGEPPEEAEAGEPSEVGEPPEDAGAEEPSAPDASAPPADAAPSPPEASGPSTPGSPPSPAEPPSEASPAPPTEAPGSPEPDPAPPSPEPAATVTEGSGPAAPERATGDGSP